VRLLGQHRRVEAGAAAELHQGTESTLLRHPVPEKRPGRRPDLQVDDLVVFRRHPGPEVTVFVAHGTSSGQPSDTTARAASKATAAHDGARGPDVLNDAPTERRHRWRARSPRLHPTPTVSRRSIPDTRCSSTSSW